MSQASLDHPDGGRESEGAGPRAESVAQKEPEEGPLGNMQNLCAMLGYDPA